MDIVKHLHEARPETLAFDPGFSVVKITGPDSLDFLQRMTTNDLVNPPPISPRMTTFISSQGRVVDHVMVWQQGGGEFWLVSLHESAAVLMDWIEQFHFVEDFSVTPVSGVKPTLLLAHRHQPPLEVDGVANYWSTASTPWEAWLTLGPQKNTHLSPLDFTTWRIAALMPAWPSEINDKAMPQAAGLQDWVSLSKGCFIGQEVVSKALTYQKRPKHLTGFKLTREQHARAQAGVTVVDVQGGEEKAAGLLTSVAPHYAAGEVNALGMIGAGGALVGGEVLVVEEKQVVISEHHPRA